MWYFISVWNKTAEENIFSVRLSRGLLNINMSLNMSRHPHFNAPSFHPTPVHFQILAQDMEIMLSDYWISQALPSLVTTYNPLHSVLLLQSHLLYDTVIIWQYDHWHISLWGWSYTCLSHVKPTPVSKLWGQLFSSVRLMAPSAL